MWPMQLLLAPVNDQGTILLLCDDTLQARQEPVGLPREVDRRFQRLGWFDSKLNAQFNLSW